MKQRATAIAVRFPSVVESRQAIGPRSEVSIPETSKITETVALIVLKRTTSIDI